MSSRFFGLQASKTFHELVNHTELYVTNVPLEMVYEEVIRHKICVSGSCLTFYANYQYYFFTFILLQL